MRAYLNALGVAALPVVWAVSAASPHAQRPAAPPPQAHSGIVAVMPFFNMSGAPTDAWIGSGIAETVMADLVRVGGLTVIDREVVLDALRELNVSEGEERMALALGRQLGATWVLRGGYQRLGDQIQITASFVDVATGDVVQTMNVDGAASGLFALQDQIVAELSARLNPAAEAAASSPERLRAMGPRDGLAEGSAAGDLQLAVDAEEDRTVTPDPLPRGPGALGPSRALTVGVSGNIGGV